MINEDMEQDCCLPLSMENNQCERNLVYKINFLKGNMQLLNQAFMITRNIDELEEAGLIPFARYLCYSDGDEEMIPFMRDVDWDNPAAPIENFKGYLNIVSKENELEAWRLIASVATSIL